MQNLSRLLQQLGDVVRYPLFQFNGFAVEYSQLFVEFFQYGAYRTVIRLVLQRAIEALIAGQVSFPLDTKKPQYSLQNTGVFRSRGDRIRTYDPLVPNQMR